MNAEDRKRLRVLSEKAKNPPGDAYVVLSSVASSSWLPWLNVSTPEVVLGLLDRIDALETEIKYWRTGTNRLDGSKKPGPWEDGAKVQVLTTVTIPVTGERLTACIMSGVVKGWDGVRGGGVLSTGHAKVWWNQRAFEEFLLSVKHLGDVEVRWE